MKTLPTIWGTYMKLVTKYQISAINSCWEKCDEKCAYTFNVYKNQLSRQTGSKNLTGPKTLPTIWHTYMKLVIKYQISAINSSWEKCDEKWAYMFNVYKNQQSPQTGSRNLIGPKTLPTIWGTYVKLVTKYQISAINSCCIFIPPLPEGGGRYTVLPLSVCPSVRPSFCLSKIFFVAFFSVTVDGRNLIFGHKRHIGIPYCG
jgi:hypothetical protein